MENIPKNSKPASKTKKRPYLQVKSVFVVQAYIVKEIVTPKVIVAAIITILGLVKAQQQDTKYPSQKVNTNNKI